MTSWFDPYNYTCSLSLELIVYSLNVMSYLALSSMQFSNNSYLISDENKKLKSVPKNSALNTQAFDAA